MRKVQVLLLLLVLAGCFFLYTQLQKQEAGKEADEIAGDTAIPPQEDPDSPATGSVPATVEEAKDWVDLTLSHQLTPASIEAWTQQQGLPLDKQIKGHPRSGQRLELSWGTDPFTTAVFDILGDEKYQLSAVRSLYPSGTSFSDLKIMLQDKVKRPIEREDETSVVFTEDEQGLTVWLARNEDGSVKVAYEYGAHTHASAEPLP